MATPTIEGTDRLRGLLINRNYALLWSGQLISSLGDFMLSATVVLWITQRIAVGQAWAPLAVSGELIAITAPTFLLGPFAGVFVDRWKQTAHDAGRGCTPRRAHHAADSAGSRWEISLSQTLRLGAIYGVLVLAATASLFFNPARFGLVGAIVAENEQARASGLLFLTLSVGITLGPALATPLYFAFGPGWALLLDALSFVVSFAAIRMIHLPHTSKQPVGGAPANAIHELWRGCASSRATKHCAPSWL